MAKEKSELEKLKVEAVKLGISFPGNISAVKLKAKVESAKSGELTEEAIEEAGQQLTREDILKREASKLRRVRITCHDPQFIKHTGITRAAGSTIYFIKRFIPFNKITHIEQVLYDFVKAAKYQWFEEKINRDTGRKYKVPRSSPSFVIEDLPDLTPVELKELAKDQKARGAIDNDD